ncbi:unnamed protein product [Clavelina lepadiformis]|uniref:Uncharacterized protein n=1 Tax=Clavelina lepadiformis TaxID=159417 RepID=A0ABP0FLS5_CLALP
MAISLNDPKLTSQLTEICLHYYNNISNLIFKMERCTYTIKEAHADLNALDFGKDPLELKNYIKKRLDKNDVKQIMGAWSYKDKTFHQRFMQNCRSVNPHQCLWSAHFPYKSHFSVQIVTSKTLTFHNT